MKNSIFIAAILLGGMVAIYQFMKRPLTFASAESRTSENAVVYNEITWQHKDGKDIWIMRQSHQGPKVHKEKWDRLAIVVDGNTNRFYQIEPGKNKFSGKEVPFSVSCFMCHPNGPRAIRPLDANWIEKVQAGLLNLRIKLYGKQVNINTNKNQVGDVPFRHPGKISNTPLTMPACMKCHQDEGWFSRGYLTRQNSITMEFMVRQEHMPPIGTLSEKERNYLKNFMDGF